MSEYAGRDAHEVYAAGSQLANDTARLAILIATLVAEQIAENRRRRYEAEAAASEARAAAAAERLRAERAAAQPLLAAVHQERFWRDMDPARLGRSWQAAAEWAPSDPYAAYTLDMLRENLRERFGIEVPHWPMRGADLSRLLAVSEPTFRKVLQEARDQAAREAQVSYAVTVTDLNDPSRILHTREMTVPAGMSPDEAAARAYQEWSRSAEGAEAAERHDQFAVQISENTGNVRSALTPAVTLRGDQVEDVLARAESHRRAIVDGTEQASDAELLYALSVEIDLLAEDEVRRLARREEYAARLAAAGLPAADRKRLAGNIAAIDEGMEALHRKQADTALRAAMTAARIRGEDPRYEQSAARLRNTLDVGWWETASAAEVAGVWDHVSQWGTGHARDEMLATLAYEVEARYRVTVFPSWSATDVAAAFGGTDMPGPATRLRDQGEALREQAEALFDLAYGSFEKAAQAQDRAAGFPEEHPLSAQAEGASAYYVAQAAAQGAQGLSMFDRGNWLIEQDPTVVRAAERGEGLSAVEQLAAEYEARWGQPLHPQAVEFLQDAEAEVREQVDRGQLAQDPGSTNPAEIKVIRGEVVITPDTESWQPDAQILREAATMTVETNFITPSMLESRLGVSRAEAEGYMQALEDRGIVAPGQGTYASDVVGADADPYVQLMREGETPVPAGQAEARRAEAFNVSLGIPPQTVGEESTGEREAQRFQERTEAAVEALADLGDSQAAEAVSVAAHGFPQSPDAATAAPPVSSKQGQGAGPQLGRERGSEGLNL